MINLGAYPALSLADAREIRAEKLAMLVRGIDPQARPMKRLRNSRLFRKAYLLTCA